MRFMDTKILKIVRFCSVFYQKCTVLGVNEKDHIKMNLNKSKINNNNLIFVQVIHFFLNVSESVIIFL
jgi:hypothetical protein